MRLKKHIEEMTGHYRVQHVVGDSRQCDSCEKKMHRNEKYYASLSAHNFGYDKSGKVDHNILCMDCYKKKQRSKEIEL